MNRKIKQLEDENVVQEDDMDGATDIVFLLIIFFLVASSFSSEKRENVQLTQRRMEPAAEAPEGVDVTPTAPKPQIQEKYDLRIVISVDADKVVTVKVNEEPLDLVEPNSIELYYKIGEQVNRVLQEVMQENPPRPIMPNTDPPMPRMIVQIWSDKRAPAGMTMNALMACIDNQLKPDVLFLQEQEAERPPEFVDTKPDPPAFDPMTQPPPGAVPPTGNP